MQLIRNAPSLPTLESESRKGTIMQLIITTLLYTHYVVPCWVHLFSVWNAIAQNAGYYSKLLSNCSCFFFIPWTLSLELLLNSKVWHITTLSCITTSCLLNLGLILAVELTSRVCCVFVVASPGRGCHLFRLSVYLKGGSTLWMTAWQTTVE